MSARAIDWVGLVLSVVAVVVFAVDGNWYAALGWAAAACWCRVAMLRANYR